MTTVDNFLLALKQHGFENLEGQIEKKDLKVLRSLSTSVCLPSFITENQARLLHKILGKYIVHLSSIDPNIEQVLMENSWSRPYRVIDQFRKMYIDKSENVIIVEFSHNIGIRKLLFNLTRDWDQVNNALDAKSKKFRLTENNLYQLVNCLRPHKFDIDQKIMDFYEIIKNYKISDAKKSLTFGADLYDCIKIPLEKELGPLENISEEKILDRQLHYQYFVGKNVKISKNPENLREKLIFRSQPKVWVDCNKFSLSEILTELKNLERFPLLLVFESWDTQSCLKNLENFSENLKKSEISGPIGIYFRLENNEVGASFNQKVKENNFNAHLNSTTLIAGVQTGKLPKFFLKDCDWTPKSVIVLGTTLRHSKTAVYSNRCDLIISYSDKEPIIENTTIPWRK